MIIGLAGLFIVFNPSSIHALSGSDFQAGNIIQDRNFYNNRSMSAAEIQAFLNSKVINCSQGYSCLKSYTIDTPTITDSQNLCNVYQGGVKVAAQIIYDVGLACGINPQVLITLLQKESGLITSTQPSSISYRSATGYGCPDSTPGVCDSSYYGFFNQLYKAAWQYKYYAKYSSSYSYRPFRTNSILWNPSASCGRSDVYIENQSTASLYIYTPYRPNSAALNNLYGTGDACSSYGNRNFWRIFSDWFGVDNKPLIRTTDSGNLFYNAGQFKYQIPSMEIAREFGFGDNDVAFVNQATLDSISSSPNNTQLSYYVKSDSDSDEDGGNIYLISNQKRYLITSMSQFAQYGLSTSNITTLPYYSLLRLPLVGNLSSFVSNDKGLVFYVSQGNKQAIYENDTYNGLNPSGNVSNLSEYILNTLRTVTPIVKSGLVLKSLDGRLWLVSEHGWYYIPSMNVASCLGFTSFIDMIPTEAVEGTQTAEATCLVTNGIDSQKYVADGSNVYPLKNEWGLNALPSTPLPSLSRGRTITTLPEGTVYQESSGSSLYTLQSGLKRHIADGDALTEYGHTRVQIASSEFLRTIPNGPLLYSSGTVVAAPDGSLFMIDRDKKRYIPSMQLFYAYGFKDSMILRVDSDSISKYSTGDPITTRAIVNNQPYIIDKSRRYSISSSMLGAYSSGSEYVATSIGSLKRTQEMIATQYIKADNSAQLYILEAGKKRPVYSWEIFTQKGGSNNNITEYSSNFITTIQTGSGY